MQQKTRPLRDSMVFEHALCWYFRHTFRSQSAGAYHSLSLMVDAVGQFHIPVIASLALQAAASSTRLQLDAPVQAA